MGDYHQKLRTGLKQAVLRTKENSERALEILGNIQHGFNDVREVGVFNLSFRDDLYAAISKIDEIRQRARRWLEDDALAE